MQKIELGQAIGILANVGVIIGIAFLALELQQNNDLMEAEARATIVSLNSAMWQPTMENADIAEMAIKDRRNETLTPAEELRLNAMWARGLFNAEYIYREQGPDQFPQAMWQRAFATYGTLRRTWSGGGPGSAMVAKDMFSPEFVEFIDSNVVGE